MRLQQCNTIWNFGFPSQHRIARNTTVALAPIKITRSMSERQASLDVLQLFKLGSRATYQRYS